MAPKNYKRIFKKLFKSNHGASFLHADIILSNFVNKKSLLNHRRYINSRYLYYRVLKCIFKVE